MKNKKGDVTFIFVSVVITIIIFFILLSFSVSSQTQLVSETQNLACKAYLNAKASDLAKIADFFYKVKLDCKSDKIELDSDLNQNEVYDQIGDRTVSCWERYDKGQSDFMSNFKTEGNWCFICSDITLSDDLDTSFKYVDFIEYINNTEIPNNKKGTYAENTNLVYVDIESQQFISAKERLDESKKSLEEIYKDKDDPNIPQLINNLNLMEKELIDLNNKNFLPEEQLFITYRYDRLPEDFSTNFNQVVDGIFKGGATGAGGALIARAPQLILVSSVTWASAVGFVKIFSNENNLQYVDIMTKEEYFRKCGTLPNFEK